MHASQKLARVHHLSEVMLGSSMVNEKVQRIKFVCLQVIGMLYTLLPQASSHLSIFELRRPPTVRPPPKMGFRHELTAES